MTTENTGPKTVRKTLLDDARELAIEYKGILTLNLNQEMAIILDKFELLLGKPDHFLMMRESILDFKRSRERLDMLIMKLERKKS